MKDYSDIGPDDHVTKAEAAQLPIRMRVGWAAYVVEQCNSLFSEYYNKHFLQEDALECAWGFAMGDPDDPDARNDLMDRIGELIDHSDEYEYHHVAPSLNLLEEIDRDDGLGASNAVDYAAMNFASIPFYRAGMRPGDPAVPTEEFYSRTVPFRIMSRRAYDVARSVSANECSRKLFRGVQIKNDLAPISQDLIDRATLRPPSHETYAR